MSVARFRIFRLRLGFASGPTFGRFQLTQIVDHCNGEAVRTKMIRTLSQNTAKEGPCAHSLGRSRPLRLTEHQHQSALHLRQQVLGRPECVTWVILIFATSVLSVDETGF